MLKIGVCLSGCGVKDGSEIHESVITLLALDRANVEIVCMAPKGPQAQVVDHTSGKKSGEKRDILAESARIARGEIKDIKDVKADSLNGIIFPGGFGAALNLCDFAASGEKCTVHKDVSRLIEEMHKAKKPIGAICIAPAIVAKVLGSQKVQLTIGTDARTAAKLEAMGAKHISCQAEDVVVDEKNKIVTTPAYMLADRISQVEKGIGKLVEKLIQMA